MLLLTFYWPKQDTGPSVISLNADKYSPVRPQQERRTGVFVCGFSDYHSPLLLTMWLDLFDCHADLGCPAWLWALLAPSVLIYPQMQGEKSLWLRTPDHCFLPARARNWSFMGDESHLIKQNSQRVSKHVLHREFPFNHSSKCYKHFLNPCYVPRTPGGAGVAPVNHTWALSRKN